MPPNKIELTNRYIGEVVKTLYDTFPVPASIPLLPESQTPEEFETHREYQRFLRAVVAFLVNEGIVHDAGRKHTLEAHIAIDSDRGKGRNLFMLTLRTLTALQVPLELVGGKTGEQVMTEGTPSPSNFTRLGALVGGVLGGFTKTISS